MLTLLVRSILFLSLNVSELNNSCLAASVHPLPDRTYTWTVDVTRGHLHFRDSDKLIITRSICGDVVSVSIRDPKLKTYPISKWGRGYLQQLVDKFINEHELDVEAKVLCHQDGIPIYVDIQKFTHLAPFAAPSSTNNWDIRLSINK